MGELYVVFGLPGAGKTRVSEILQENTDEDAEIHHTDKTRKEEIVAAGDPDYSTPETHKTYSQLGLKGWKTLKEDDTAILDGTFSDWKPRQMAYRIAEREGVDIYFLRVECDDETARDRIRRRQATGESYSDADTGIRDDVRQEFTEPVMPHYSIDNSGDLGDTREQIENVRSGVLEEGGTDLAELSRHLEPGRKGFEVAPVSDNEVVIESDRQEYWLSMEGGELVLEGRGFPDEVVEITGMFLGSGESPGYSSWSFEGRNKDMSHNPVPGGTGDKKGCEIPVRYVSD